MSTEPLARSMVYVSCQGYVCVGGGQGGGVVIQMSDLALSSGSSCVVSFMGCYAVLGFIKGSEEEHYVFSNCILM